MFLSRYEVEEKRTFTGWRGESHNVVKVERTGYVPLSVRLKQFTLAGIQMQLQSRQFDFNDYKALYHDMEVISPYEDMEETQAKLNRYYSALAQIQMNKMKNQNENVQKDNNNGSEKTDVSSDSE